MKIVLIGFMEEKRALCPTCFVKRSEFIVLSSQTKQLIYSVVEKYLNKNGIK